MISAQEAFVIASRASPDELAPKAFYCGDSWVFECKDTEAADSWPAVVNKEDGRCYSMGMKKSFEFWQKIDSFKSVEVSE